MKSDFHTHTTYCDGKHSPEEIILYAEENGFSSIGFSGHGYTGFDLRYCMKDADGYIAEINALKEKYNGRIQVYLGIEEDMYEPADRSRFDYIIGSCHYFCLDGKYYPIDSNYDYFKKCIEAFGGDILKLSQTYYECFCSYILKRKPDIIGHFDVITKFDEIDEARFLCNEKYFEISEKYVQLVSGAGALFEVNTGAVSRGFRNNPYPHERLLHILKKSGCGLILSSDSHDKNTLGFGFDEAIKMLRSFGIKELYTIYNKRFEKYGI